MTELAEGSFTLEQVGKAVQDGSANSADVLDRFSKEHPEAVDRAVPNQDGHTLLHLTARHGHVELVELLLRRGASVALTDDDGQTPLHVAYHLDRLSQPA